MPPPPGFVDLLDWAVMDSRRFTLHLVDTWTGFEGTDKFFWIKNIAGFPWDINLYDTQALYLWITENADQPPVSRSGYKRFVNPVSWAPRYFQPGTTITLTSPAPNLVKRTVNCEADNQAPFDLGHIQCVTEGPFNDVNWGGDLGNAPYIVVSYFWGGSGVYTTRERFYLANGWGRFKWDSSHWNGSTYVVDQSIVHTVLAPPGTPALNFGCRSAAAWANPLPGGFISLPFVGPIAGASGQGVIIPGGTVPPGQPGAPSTSLVVSYFPDQSASSPPNVFNINSGSNLLDLAGTVNIGGNGYMSWFGVTNADDDGFLYSVGPSALNQWKLQKTKISDFSVVGLMGPGLFSEPLGNMYLYDVTGGPATAKLAAWSDFFGDWAVIDRERLTRIARPSTPSRPVFMASDAAGHLWMIEGSIVYKISGALTFTGSAPTAFNSSVLQTIDLSARGTLYKIVYYPAADQMIVSYTSGGQAGLQRINCSDGSSVGFGTVPSAELLSGVNTDGQVVLFNAADGFYFVDVTTITGAAATISSTYYPLTSWAITNVANVSPIPNVGRIISAFDWATPSVWVWQSGTNAIYRLLFGTPKGRIVVNKVTSRATSKRFTFHGSWGEDFTLGNGESHDSGLLDLGTYSVTEDPETGWTTTTDVDPASLVVVASHTTSVTFTNTFEEVCAPLNDEGDLASGVQISDLDLFIGPATALYNTPLLPGQINSYETSNQGRRTIVLDFNNSDGVYARDLGTVFSWPVFKAGKPKTALFAWQPSVIAMPEGIYGRATDWMDGGTPGAKYIQGIMVEGDSFGSAKSFVLQDSDTLATHALNELPATFTKQTVKAFSCVVPFVAHSARLLSTDGVEWRVWQTDLVFQPWPELCRNWQAEMTSLGLTGWGHVREMNIPHVSTADLILVLTFDAWPTITLTIPNSGGLQIKQKVTVPANKFKLMQPRIYSTEDFRLFEKDMELKIKSWGSYDFYRIIKPFGGPSREGALV